MVRRQPGLVEELSGVAVVHQCGAQVGERIAVAFVVLILEAGHKSGAGSIIAAIEGQAAVVEHPVRACAHCGVGGHCECFQRRCQSGCGLVLGVTGKQRALPGLSAIRRLEHTQPGIAGLIAGVRRKRDVHCPVVVRAGQQVDGVAG